MDVKAVALRNAVLGKDGVVNALAEALKLFRAASSVDLDSHFTPSPATD
jgi:hypothetical protein